MEQSKMTYEELVLESSTLKALVAELPTCISITT
jgi:hypothetical protein